MPKKIILVTGSGGMVGQNLLEHPDISKYEILSPSSKELDLRNFEDVENFLLKYKPKMIIHAAGKIGGIQANIREPISFLVDNLDMGRNIIMAAYKTEIKELINIGSSCMYPANISSPLKEDMLLSGKLEETNEGYAIAKLTTARLCDYVSREDSSFIYKTLIPCNLYGRFDKFKTDYSHLVAAIIHKVYQAKKNNNNEVEVWGDGLARREFMYAGDLADAIIWSINHFDKLPKYMNIGLGADMTVNEYYAAVAKVIDFNGNFTHDKTKPVGMIRKLINTDLQTKLGWNPKTSLEAGLKKTYEFYLKEIAQ
ncbi:MAG: GDP-fucose synthetase [Nitrosomonadales bacterium]|nr:GDP-fucose synthetase [Nitrosomonadales bacterium]|tara:strand:- start:782 stop:1714 length:933 start_codon:yes stop_codon:yes gene_type:complete